MEVFMKRLIRASHFKVIGTSLLLASLATPAGANPAFLINTQLSVSLLALVSSGYCISYTYDQNGNRLTQSGLNFGSSGATWGAVPYGCFIWAP
jgi:hypothetical protein